MKKSKSNLSTKIINTTLFLLLSIIFYIGIGMIAYGSGIGHSYIVRQNVQKANSRISIKSIERAEKERTSYDASKTESVSASSLWKARKYSANAIGRMSMPELNIHNPIFAGYGDHNQNLSYGVVTTVNNRKMGDMNNYVLAGHYMGNYGPAILDNLHYASKGDRIYVTNLKKIYVYSVTYKSYSVKPTQVDIENNIPGKSTITLITCSDFNVKKYGFGGHRTVVKGHLIASMPATRKNLELTELTDGKNKHKKKTKVVVNIPNKKNTSKSITIKSKVKSSAKAKWYQNITFNQLVVGFTIIWLIFVIYNVYSIWKLDKK